MALFTSLLRPSQVLRRRALHEGVLGDNLFWRLMAGVIFGRRLLKWAFGRRVQHLGTIELKQNRSMMVQTIKPLSRRQRRKRKRAGSYASAGERRREAQALAMALSKADD